MTPNEISTLQDSFRVVQRRSRNIGGLFYSTAFEKAPCLKPMFKPDMTEQSQKMTGMLVYVIASLERLDTVLPIIEGLGERHRQYGLSNDDYDMVKRAFLDTLKDVLRAKYTPEVHACWDKLLTLMIDTMMRKKLP